MAPSGPFFQGDAGNRAKSGARGPMDPWAILLWFAAVMVAAMALPAANWADNLGVVPMVAAAGLGLGLLLVGSKHGGVAVALKRVPSARRMRVGLSLPSLALRLFMTVGTHRASVFREGLLENRGLTLWEAILG